MGNKLMLWIISLLLLILACGIPVFAAENAVIKEVIGKVEIKLPPGGWTLAQVGAVISPGTTISVGFNSKAVLELPSSIIYVKQLTRLTLSELVKEQGQIKTGLYLRTGSLQAEVKTGVDYTNDFKVKSPVATAAVRGTVIQFDGGELRVEDGVAILYNSLGQPLSVLVGGIGSSTGLDLNTVKDILDLLTDVQTQLSKEGLIQKIEALKDSALVTVDLEW